MGRPNKRKKMNLQMIKLVTGEVVLGKADDSVSKEEITLLKPMTMMLDPMQGGVGMIPYDAIYTQEEPETITFSRLHIIDAGMAIHPSFEDAYLKQTTGLETPQTEIIA